MKLERRKFLQKTLVAGAAMAAVKPIDLVAASAAAFSPAEEFPWAEATIDQLQHAMAAGQVTAVELDDRAGVEIGHPPTLRRGVGRVERNMTDGQP